MPQHAIELGCLCLGFGDPVASLVGKKWGTRKLVHEKSAAGTLAFFTICVIVGVVFLTLVRPDLGLLSAVAVAALVAAVGAITELVSQRWDDNFTIPLAAGLAAMMLL